VLTTRFETLFGNSNSNLPPSGGSFETLLCSRVVKEPWLS